MEFGLALAVTPGSSIGNITTNILYSVLGKIS